VGGWELGGCRATTLLARAAAFYRSLRSHCPFPFYYGSLSFAAVADESVLDIFHYTTKKFRMM